MPSPSSAARPPEASTGEHGADEDQDQSEQSAHHDDANMLMMRSGTKPGPGSSSSGGVGWVWFRVVVVGVDEVGGVFGDHDGGGVGVAADDPRHHRGVDDP